MVEFLKENTRLDWEAKNTSNAAALANTQSQLPSAGEGNDYTIDKIS
jgi:hypothetical protein